MKVIRIGIAHGVVASIATMSIMACLGSKDVKQTAQPKPSTTISFHAKVKTKDAPAIHAAN